VDTDPASGKPLLTYENPEAKASQLLSDRTAPSFDPTVAQKVDPTSLQDPRMKESVSQGIKQSIGGDAFEELDHIMPLELGGSNNKSNLRLEAADNPNQKYSGSNPTPTDPLENQLAAAVHNGDMSLVDAWKQMAQAKGLTLPEQGGKVPNINQTQNDQNPDNSILGKAAAFIRNAFTPQSENKVFNALGGNAILHPIDTLNTIVSNAKNDIDTTLKNLGASAKEMVAPNQNAAQRTSNILNFLTSAATTAMAPVSESFNIASQLPIIKPAADATGLVFNKTGQIGGFAAGKLLDSLPLSQQTKDTLSESVKNVGSLAGQIVLGGYIFGKATGLMDAKGAIAPEAEKSLVEDAQQKAQEVNSGAKSAPAAETPPAPAAEKTEIASPATEKAPEVTPVEGTGQTKTSGLASGVESKAIEEKLTRGFGDLPQYKSVSMKDQAAKALDLINSDYKNARDIAMGRVAPPEGILPESVFVAVEDKALKEGDVNTLRDLATQSSLVGEATTMGQRIRSLAERDEASPVEAIKEVQNAREKAAQGKLAKGDTLEKAKGRIADDIKREIKKTAPKKEDWSSFVNSIKC